MNRELQRQLDHARELLADLDDVPAAFDRREPAEWVGRLRVALAYLADAVEAERESSQ